MMAHQGVMTGNITPVVSRPKLGEPVLVPMAAVAAALLLVLGMGLALGWMAARGWSSAPPPAPTLAEQRCSPPEPPVTRPAAARLPEGDPAPAGLEMEPPRPATTEPPRATARRPSLRIARSGSSAGDGWEPARM
jgi:hypothetical protein